jgi:hypothetical protein
VGAVLGYDGEARCFQDCSIDVFPSCLFDRCIVEEMVSFDGFGEVFAEFLFDVWSEHLLKVEIGHGCYKFFFRELS